MSKSSHKMNNLSLPDDCAKQWEILLLLLSSEEKKIDRTTEKEIDTVNYFYRNEGVRKILLQWLKQMHQSYARKTSEWDTAQKCDDVSLLWRQRGNDKFRAELYEESYQCYSKSVMYAHQNGPMFPLALANRSAALLKMKKFQECLSDVDLALEHGYPREQRHKLLLRRTDCHIELQQREKALESLQLAATHALSLGLSAVHTAEFDRHIKKLEEKLANTPPAQPEAEEPLPPPLGGDNPDFVAASTALELRRSDVAGRYVVTREPLRRGDVIFSEEPYAWVALAAELPVCEACCATTSNPTPCVQCSRSVYCSLSCRARAHNVHRWECAGAQADLFATIGIAHLALRVLLVTANEGFPAVPLGQPAPSSACDLFTSYSQVDDLRIYSADTSPFYRMFNLVTNFDKMNNADYIQYALTATMLTLYLENYTEFFRFLPSRVPYRLTESQLRTFVAALMLRSLGQLVCNGHAALSLLVDNDETGCTISEREVRRATAIYPSAAMMNHACDPNIINTFHNSRLIIRCSRELPAGAEVFNCYGPHKAREPTAHRRAQLRAQYLFNCNCSACNDNERKDFVLLFTAYACQSCKGPVVWGRRTSCPQCHAEFQLERALSALEHADELLAQADRASSLDVRCERTQAALRVKQLAWHRHHRGLRALADRLARLYADLGEFSKSVELIKQNIQSLEYQFGSFSAEVAHELRKLSEVMLERIIRSPQNPDYRDWCLEGHKIIKKAVQLTDLNYGSWEPLVKRLKEQESLIATFLSESRAPDDDCVHHNLHYNLKI
ncbi:SET and MYND domain-containing protein 4-like [Plodia interpunctella]|uniref:SET and MYND domain-containing protein 4-like n=1 Tax=Plodia interpunctella TaxID=58824 RepID=UPI002367439C|nr:SET and MYND domain-containing protein 4-like [Plodia interpunctella]